MLDKLVINIPFKRSAVSEGKFGCTVLDPHKYDLHLAARDIRLNRFTQHHEHETYPDFVGPPQPAHVVTRWEVNDLISPWESLPSHYSGLAVKAWIHGNGFEKWPYIQIKCSPAKLLQGHNIFGPSSIPQASGNMVYLLGKIYPELVDDLDFETADVREIDVTYSFRLPKKNMVKPLHAFLQKVSKGHTKGSGGYETTSYFGSRTSRQTHTKIYDKLAEVLQNGFEGITDKYQIASLIDHATGLQRIEVRLKHEWFQRRGISTNLVKFAQLTEARPELFRTWWANATAPLFQALTGQEIKVMVDDKVRERIDLEHGHVRGRTNKLFSFYLQIKHLGFDTVKDSMPKNTFNDNVNKLLMAGISRATLQNVGTSSYADVVVQLPKLISIDAIGEHFPSDYRPPVNLWELEAA